MLLALIFPIGASRPACGRDGVAGESGAEWRPHLDHVMFAVHDLESAESAFEAAGFRLGPGGRQPTGIRNRIVAFEGKSYLEPLDIWDESRAFPELVSFLATTEGGFSLALRVSSVDQTAARLREMKLPVADPGGGGSGDGENAPPSFFRYLAFTEPVVPNRLFFIEYDEEVRRQIVESMPVEERNFTEHPNGARALVAVWVGVEHLVEAAAQYSDLGLPVESAELIPSLGAVGSCVRVGEGCILLLEPRGEGSLVGSLLAGREPGSILGVTISVEDLNRAAAFAEGGDGKAPEAGEGFFGRSVRIPAARLHGLALEMVEVRR